MAPASGPACRRALGNAEIRRLVCVYLSLGDLCRASTVNKNWEGTASPLIWVDLPSLMPLLRLIPTSYVVEAYDTAAQNPLSRAPISALLRQERAAKRRSRRLAALVKRLRVTENDLQDRSGIPLVFWFGPTVFPSLARLAVDRCKDFGNDHVVLLRQLLPSTLHALDVGGVNESSWELASSFPSLRNLFVDGNIELQRVSPWRLTSLTRIDLVVRYSSELIGSLACSCPILHTIDLDIRDDQIDVGAPLTIGASFPALRNLEIRGACSASLAQSIIESLPECHPMEAIFVYDAKTSFNPPGGYRSIVDSINRFCDPKAVQLFGFLPRRPVESATGLIPLHPLASLSNLRHLALRSWHDLALADADCAQLPTWWPRIHSLALCNMERTHNARLLTLAALFPFVKMCDDLVRLGLVFDARSALPQIPGSLLPSPSRVENLAVYDSPIARESVDGVGRLLGALFPRLRSIVSSKSQYKPLWDEISAKLSRGALTASNEGSYGNGGGRDDSGSGDVEARTDGPHAMAEMSLNTPVVRHGQPSAAASSSDIDMSTGLHIRPTQAGIDRASQSGPLAPESLRQHLTELEQRNSYLEKQNSELERARAKLERRYNTMEDSLDREIHEVQQRNSDLAKALAAAETQKDELARELKETEAHYESQEKRLLSLEHSIKAETEMARAIEAVRQERDKLSRRLTSVCRERDEHADRYEALKHHADQLQASYEDAEKRILEMTADRASVHRALTDLAFRTSDI